MIWREHISSDPQVLMGKPVIRGTRISVGFLLNLFAQGWTKEQVIESYPQLTLDNIQAVFAYSAARIKDEDILPVKNGTIG